MHPTLTHTHTHTHTHSYANFCIVQDPTVRFHSFVAVARATQGAARCNTPYLLNNIHAHTIIHLTTPPNIRHRHTTSHITPHPSYIQHIVSYYPPINSVFTTRHARGSHYEGRCIAARSQQSIRVSQ